MLSGFFRALFAFLPTFFASGPWGGGYNNNKGNNWFQGFRGASQVPNPKLFLWAIVLAPLALWLCSGLYVVQPDEEAVETRFGKYTMTTLPGLHYHMPFPIERATMVRVTSVQRLEVGYRSAPDNYSDGRGSDNEGLLLTKDENIVDVNFEIQWRIKSVQDYIFNFRSSEVGSTVRHVAESAVREIIGRQDISTLLEGSGRAILADDLQHLLQSLFDQYGMGIQVVSIQFKKVDPPPAVIDAFRDVQSARADKERAVNVAYAYANDIIPRARGEAAAGLNDASAYKTEVISGALGETQRFTSVYNQYKVAKDLTKEKMYVDVMNDVMAGMDKIIVDKNGNSVYYLPLPEMMKKAKR